jgi:hypothetical protein
VAGVRDGARTNPVFPNLFDLIARLKEECAAFGGPLVEVRKLLTILAERYDRWSLALARCESTEAIIGEGQPVAAFGVLAFVDDVQAGLALPLDELPYGGLSGQAFGCRQTAYVRSQNFVGALLHLSIIRE